MSRYVRMFEGRNYSPNYAPAHLGAAFGSGFKRLTGFGYKKNINVVSSDKSVAAYFDENELKQSTNYFRRVWKDKRKINWFLKEQARVIENGKKLEAWAWRQNWKKKSTEELLRLAEKFLVALFDSASAHVISNPQHVKPLEEELYRSLGKDNHERVIQSATYFHGSLPWDSQNREIAKAHANWRKMSVSQKETFLDRLTVKYGWINTVEGLSPFTKKHFRSLVLNYKAPAKVSRIKNIPVKAMEVGSVIGKLGNHRFWTRYHLLHLRYHLNQILGELVKRSCKPELSLATVQEIKDFYLGKRVDLREVKNRASGFVCILKKGETKILTGEAANVFLRKTNRQAKAVKSVSGSIGNRGYAKGRVRIISFVDKNYEREVESFKKGEVLVTGMTRPQIVHLCSNASAIVTDEGGITSHAAVVSREFGIPCVIGTMEATKLFKTGDVVIVDADKGIVKKI